MPKTRRGEIYLISRACARQLAFRKGEALEHMRVLRATTDPVFQNELHEKAFVGNLSAVYKIAWQFQRVGEFHGLDIDDLVQAGCLGLLRAIELFDPKQEVQFLTYASWWIRAAIMKELEVKGPDGKPRVPRRILETFKGIRDARQGLSEIFQRPATDNEVYDYLCSGKVTGQFRNNVGLALAYQASSSLYLNAPADEDPGTTWADIIPGNEPTPEENVLHDRLLDHIRKAVIKALHFIQNLEDRLYVILTSRLGIFGPPRSLSDLGAQFSLSKERVRQLEAKTSKRMRQRTGIDFKELCTILETLPLPEGFELKIKPVAVPG
jgi:RNA polymerase sigma factor (sigma-70 family)